MEENIEVVEVTIIIAAETVMTIVEGATVGATTPAVMRTLVGETDETQTDGLQTQMNLGNPQLVNSQVQKITVAPSSFWLDSTKLKRKYLMPYVWWNNF